ALRVVRDAAQLLRVRRDRLAEREEAPVRRVLGLPLLDGADRRLAERVGGDEVRLADAERDNPGQAGGEVEELADAARGQPAHALARERSPGERHAAGLIGWS